MTRNLRVSLGVAMSIIALVGSFFAGYIVKGQKAHSTEAKAPSVAVKKLDGYVPGEITETKFVTLKEGDGGLVSESNLVELIVRVADAGTGDIVDDTHASFTSTLRITARSLPLLVQKAVIGQKADTSLRMLVPSQNIDQVKGLISSTNKLESGVVMDIRIVTVN